MEAEARAFAKAPAAHALVSQVAERIDAPIVVGLGHGFILTAMLWGSFFALIIDRRLRRAAVFILICAVFTLFGIIHSLAPAGEMYLPTRAPGLVWQWSGGYLLLAVMMLGLSFSKSARPIA